MSRHPAEKRILELAFDLQVVTRIWVNAEKIRELGAPYLSFPEEIVEHYASRERALMLELSPGFFSQYDPEFFEDRVEMYLSFDAVYRVVIPYAFVESIQTFHNVDDWSEPDRGTDNDQRDPPVLKLVS